MNKSDLYLMNRRGILKGSAAALGGALLGGEPMEAHPKKRQHELQPFNAEDHRHADCDGGKGWARPLPHHPHRH